MIFISIYGVLLFCLTYYTLGVKVPDGVCIKKLVNGKLVSVGDCQKDDGPEIAALIKKNLAEKVFPSDCTKVIRSKAKVLNETGGLFDIYPESEDKPVEVYCDLKTDGGGWIVFQRRRDGSENFRRNWTDYAKGFGKLNNEFWLGLETIHQLTKNANYELRIDLGDFEGNTTYAQYGIFNIASGNDKYRLEVGDHSGPIPDEMVYHDEMNFTTEDSDNDGFAGNCALDRKGAWWFDNGCGYLNLNGIYYKDGKIDNTGIYWWYWMGDFHSLKFTEMKLRKKT